MFLPQWGPSARDVAKWIWQYVSGSAVTVTVAMPDWSFSPWNVVTVLITGLYLWLLLKPEKKRDEPPPKFYGEGALSRIAADIIKASDPLNLKVKWREQRDGLDVAVAGKKR